MNANPRLPVLTTLFAAACSLAFAAEPETPTAKTALFNGKDTEGWVSYLKNGAPADQTWSVKDGLLVCTGAPAGFLRTEKSNSQYEFTVEWRFTNMLANKDALARADKQSSETKKQHDGTGVSGRQTNSISLRVEQRLAVKNAPRFAVVANRELPTFPSDLREFSAPSQQAWKNQDP